MAYSNQLSELVGAVIGDGNIWARKYEIVISGHVIKDAQYFEFLAGIVKEFFDYSPRIFYRSGALRLVIRSKRVFSFFKRFFPKGKTAKTVSIPRSFKNKAVLKEIFDTDGSIFFSRKPGVIAYPTIEISTISKKLASQVVRLLKVLKFNPRIRTAMQKNEIFKIALHGKRQVSRWLDLIGSSNPTKLEKLVAAANLVNA